MFEEGFLYLDDDIDPDSVRPVIQDLTEIAMMPDHVRPDHVILFINTDGGSAASAFHLIDVMKQMPIPVATYGIGSVSSAGLLILMAGTKGLRVATDNTMLMSHQFAAGAAGKHHELVAINSGHDIMDALILKRYMNSTGKSERYVRSKMLPASDVYMTAAMAKQYGIIDQVIVID